MANLGHCNELVHWLYAKKARVVCPALESMEVAA